MNYKTIITVILGIFLLISCGPRRYRCGPNRRCEVEQNSLKPLLEKQSFKKTTQNS